MAHLVVLNGRVSIAKCPTFFVQNKMSCCSVAVLQFSKCYFQNLKLYLYLYIYLYIYKYRVKI